MNPRLPLPPLTAKYRQRANLALLEKTLSELLFEEALTTTPCSDGYRLILTHPADYRFCATRSIWGQLLIVPGSVTRNNSAALCPLQLLIDAQQALNTSDITLANLLEEMSNTLLADSHLLLNRHDLSAADLANLDPDLLQSYLDGHPKAIANKGRMHWGMSEHQQYAPEHGQNIQLHWLATQHPSLQVDIDANWDSLQLLKQALDEQAIAAVAAQLHCTEAELTQWHFIPVHPWQWDHKLHSLFANQLAEEELIYLGQWGDGYLPQQSLRTLSNRQRAHKLDIKLPITVLNTSCYRGIPGKYIRIGAQLSSWLHQVTQQDPVLKNTLVLRELAGLHYPHPLFEQIQQAPYRFNEMLGVIWRENVQSRLPDTQRGIMMGALWQCDNQGAPLLHHWLETSTLTLDQWLEALFNSVVIPLYHLLCCYGIGLVAHGQNITVILQAGRPVGVAFKDFQGDMRLLDQILPEHAILPTEVLSTLDRLPAAHLIHDLQTGHFVTALRFLSAMLWKKFGYPEINFYQQLGQVLRCYQADQPQLAKRFSTFDLFTPTCAKLCMNRVRLRIGYDDSSERPQLILGSEIDNPLYLSEQSAIDNIVAIDT